MQRFEELKAELIGFLRDFMGAKFPDLSSVDGHTSIYDSEALKTIHFEIIPRTEYLNNHITVVVGCQALRIQIEAINFVAGCLESYAFSELKKLASVILNPHDTTVILQGYVPCVEIPGEGARYDDGAVGANFIKIDQRFEGLKNLVFTEFEFISKRLTDAATQYCGDKTKAKLDDVIFRLNTKLPGEDTEFFFTVSRVPHTFDGNKIEPTMTPMTEEDKFLFLGYPVFNAEKAEAGILLKDEIEAALGRVNDAVNHFVYCREAIAFGSCFSETVRLVNTILIPTVVTVQLKPFSIFGGTYELLMSEKGETLNSEACLAVIDTVLGDLWSMLEKAYEDNVNDEIAYFAIDSDSFGIYGMSQEDKPIHTVVSGPYTFRNAIERYHSGGFIEVFKRYLKTVKNKHVFTHIGKIDKESIRTASVPRDLETIDDIIDRTKRTETEEGVLKGGLTGNAETTQEKPTLH